MPAIASLPLVRALRVGALAVAAAAMAGCAREPAVYETESFGQSATYSRTYDAAPAAACDAARRALLSQGYNLDKAQPDSVAANKNFSDEEGRHAQLIFNVTCAPDGGTGERATVFVNALQDRYSVKKTSSSASVGVSVLGAVSLPFGSGDDALVKTSSETITRKSFYDGFFGLLQKYLPAARAASPAASQAQSSGTAPLSVPAAPVPRGPAAGDLHPGAAAPAVAPPAAPPSGTVAPDDPQPGSPAPADASPGSPAAGGAPAQGGAAPASPAGEGAAAQ